MAQAQIPAPDPHITGWNWPVGFRRPKTAMSWLSQIGWVIGMTLFINVVLDDAQAIWLALGPVAILSIVWIEFEARCEDRALVMRIFWGWLALLAAWEVHDRHKAQQEQEQADRERQERFMRDLEQFMRDTRPR